MKVYMKVPYEEKDIAKQHGAKWDRGKRKWWFPEDKITEFVENKWERVAMPQSNVRSAIPTSADGSKLIRGWFDGGSRGNPGVYGYGSIVRSKNGKVMSVRMGGGSRGTNNEAEYQGAKHLLESLCELLNKTPMDPKAHICIYGDSKMVINQINGDWECRAENLIPLYEKCRRLAKEIRDNTENVEHLTLEWVPREKNGEADDLANIAMDRFKPATV